MFVGSLSYCQDWCLLNNTTFVCSTQNITPTLAKQADAKLTKMSKGIYTIEYNGGISFLADSKENCENAKDIFKMIFAKQKAEL